MGRHRQEILFRKEQVDLKIEREGDDYVLKMDGGSRTRRFDDRQKAEDVANLIRYAEARMMRHIQYRFQEVLGI